MSKETQEIKAILIKILKALERISPPPPPTPPPTPPAPPPVTRVQEYYKVIARKRIDVKTTKTEPYEITHKGDPKVMLLIACGDDLQVDFDKEVTEDSPPIFDKSALSVSTEGVSKVYAQSWTTDLVGAKKGLFILLLG